MLAWYRVGAAGEAIVKERDLAKEVSFRQLRHDQLLADVPHLRERECVCVFVWRERERERERVCVCVERERERESVCVCVCERERVCVCERERESVCVPHLTTPECWGGFIQLGASSTTRIGF